MRRPPKFRGPIATKAQGHVALGFIVVMVLMGASPALAASPQGPGSTFYATAPTTPKGAEIVYLGIEPITFNGISLSDDTFQTNFYIWWRWKGPIDPSVTTDILNATSSSSNFSEQFSYTDASGQEKPTKLADGYNYQTAVISAGIADPFSVSRYPLDHQDLTIRVENNTYDEDQLVYVPDNSHLSVHPNFDVPGWNVTGEHMSSLLHHYGTDFGVVGQGAAASQYSQLTYDVAISRPVPHFIWKLLLPMIVVVFSGLLALAIKTDEYDIRPAMAGTALLTLIFLQQGYSSDLPPTVPIVLMDNVYALAYVAVGVVFCRAVYVMNKVHHHEREAAEFVKNNTIITLGTTAAFLVAVGLLIAF